MQNGRPFDFKLQTSNYSGGGFCASTEFWLCFQYVAVCSLCSTVAAVSTVQCSVAVKIWLKKLKKHQ
jgi:hypothetical protein